MFKVIKYTVAVFALSVSVANAQQMPDSVLTLQQCIDIGVKNNLLVKQSELQMETSRIYWNQARENLLPTLNGDITHSFNEGRSINSFTNTYVTQPVTLASYGLSSSLILSSGLSLQNSIKQTSLAYQAGKMDFEQAKNSLTLNLIIAYLQVLSSEDQLKQANTQAEVSQKQLERTEILNKDGAVTPSQLYDLRGQLAGDQGNVINARNTLDISKLNLLQLMNVQYRKDIHFQRQMSDNTPSNYNQTADEVYAVALSDFALVKAGTLRRESAEKGVTAAKGALLPQLALSGGINTSYSSVGQQGIGYGEQFRNNYSTYFRLGLNIPILNYFQNRNRVSLAKVNLQGAHYTEQTNQVQLRINVDQAYANMGAAYDRYQQLTKQVEAYGESFRIAETRFNSGVLTSVEFLVVKGNLDRARTSLINAKYDYLIRAKVLDYYQGKLSL